MERKSINFMVNNSVHQLLTIFQSALWTYVLVIITTFLCLRYIESHKATKLDQEPNFDYLGQPLNGYFMIRHVALGWAEIRENVFKAENKTREIFGKFWSFFGKTGNWTRP